MIYKDCTDCLKNTESLISYVKRKNYSEVMTPFPYLLTEEELAKRGLRGIFIGKKHIPVLKKSGFHHIGGDAMDAIGEKGSNRFFAVYHHEASNTKAIVTWTIGSNSHPGRNFFNKESEVIIEMLNHY